MALIKEYVIQEADNNLWYTEDHNVSLEDRWTPYFTSSYRFPTLAVAELELESEYFCCIYKIVEVIRKEVG